MRQLYYTIRYLLRGRGGNVIKVLSLTLGLGVGLILFARVAFELSFDTFFDRSCVYIVSVIKRIEQLSCIAVSKCPHLRQLFAACLSDVI